VLCQAGRDGTPGHWRGPLWQICPQGLRTLWPAAQR
jgi:hypothetical protein